MAQGRGLSAMSVVLVLFCTLVLYCDMAYSASYVVGDGGGWMFNVVDWPQGRSFRAGDTLVFNYNPAFHNMVVVDQNGYNACTAGAGSKVFNSGHDVYQLPQGQSYFICTFPGHCQADMKIAVHAA